MRSRRLPQRFASSVVGPVLISAALVPFANVAHAARDGGVRSATSPADASPDAAGVADAGEADPATLRAERAAIDALERGTFANDVPLDALFGVDLHDDAQVARRATELDRAIVDLRAQLARRPDGGREDAGGSGDAAAEGPADVARAQLALDEARLAFLRKPRADRLSVVAAEAEHRKAQAAAQEADAQRRAAEEARDDALARARSASESGDRAVANELARAEGTRAAQAAFRQAIAERQSELAAYGQKADAEAFTLEDEARAARDEAADAVYDRVVAALERGRDRLQAQLDASRHAPSAPAFEVHLPVGRESSDADGADLRTLQRTLADDARALDAASRDLAWSALDDAGDRVAQLNATRLALIDRLTPDKRGRVLGLDAEGRAQLRREVRQVVLVARWRWETRRRSVAALLATLRSPSTLEQLVPRLVLFALLLAVARAVRRRAPSALEATRAFVARTWRSPLIVRPLAGLCTALRLLTGELVTLAVVLLAPALLPLSPGSALGTAYAIVLAYALYRLGIAAAYRTIAWAGSTPLAAVTAKHRDDVLRSVRLVGLYVLAVSVFLVLSEAVLGRGYLFQLAARFAWLGAMPIAALLVRWWRDDIADAYLRQRSNGALPDAVRRTRRHWYGFFVVLAAFVFVFTSWLSRNVRRFVLGFEQSRRALAYLFRRRLEKYAVEQGGAAPSRAPLPESVLASLSGAPVEGEPYALDRFPEIDTLPDALHRWSRGGALGALLVVGKTGYGKTSWLHAAARRITLPVVRLPLARPIDGAPGLLDRLVTAFGAPAGTSLDELATHVRSGERSVVIVDDLHDLVLRAVGGLDAWEAFHAFVERVGDHVFWLCAMGHYPHEYLTWARACVDAFRRVVVLPRWTEKEIADLLLTRTRATGHTPVYEDLVVDDLQGEERQARLVSTEQEYMRLLWDYADGSPRAALHFWARSLLPENDHQLRVRLFRRPDEDWLERLDDPQRFVLASVVWHENVGIDGAAQALRFPRLACADAFERLRERGVLVAQSDRYRVSTEWWPAVTRFLRRKHLIES